MSKTRRLIYAWSKIIVWTMLVIYVVLFSFLPALSYVSYGALEQSVSNNWEVVLVLFSMTFVLTIGIGWLRYFTAVSQIRRRMQPLLHAGTFLLLAHLLFSYYIAIRLVEHAPSIPNWVASHATAEFWWSPLIVLIIAYGAMLAARKMPKDFGIQDMQSI